MIPYPRHRSPHTSRFSPRLSAGALILCLAATGLQAAVSDFDADAYPGVAGNGWAGPWTRPGNSGATIEKQVINAKPLDNAGRYLEQTLTIASDPSTPVKSGGASREIDAGAIALNKAFTVSFAFRGDSPAGKLGPFRLFQTDKSKVGTGSTDTWALYPKSDGYWRAIDGTRDGGSATEKRLIAYKPGETYLFTIAVDPESQSYNVTVKTSDGTTATLKNLGFRTAALSAGPYLNFMASGFADPAAPVSYTFAIDTLSVVPAQK